MRSAVASNSYQKYVTATLATDVSEKTMSLIMENKDLYPGVDVEEDSVRVYEDSKYFAPLIGYTGQISAEEMESTQRRRRKLQKRRYRWKIRTGAAFRERSFRVKRVPRPSTSTIWVKWWMRRRR